MAQAQLHIDLTALQANWRALDALSSAQVQTAATVKANGYGLGAGHVAHALARAGARRFFVAVAEEGVAVRAAIGPELPIHVYGGHMNGDARLISEARLSPMLNSAEQLTRHFEALPGHPFGIQLDTGMNRLGMEPAEWQAVAEIALSQRPDLIMSHLACADDPGHPMNARQLAVFRALTEGCGVARSLSATGGVLLGPEYHFDMTRPGIGLYGGAPFSRARPVVRLAIPVIQIRDVAAGETVGYSNTFTAPRDMRLATIAAGYADGIHRALSGKATLWAGDTACPLVGRVSMDLLTIDVTDAPGDPDTLDLLGPEQGVDDLADVIGTIGYEVLTGLGQRYARRYHGAA
ncbi:MAG: alanine racemase [Roseinatronobacter sp.]|nr:alanine racemase [Roseinatronobacter sp.]